MTQPTSPAMQKAAHDLPVVAPPSTDGRIHESPMPTPLDLRLIDWAKIQIVTPRRVGRFLFWVFSGVTNKYERVREFTVVQLSRKVESDDYDERQTICAECEAVEMVEGTSRGGRVFVYRYCGACNCPQWGPARLSRKNWKARHRCPLRKHPGKYPQRGCSGCGAKSGG